MVGVVLFVCITFVLVAMVSFGSSVEPVSSVTVSFEFVSSSPMVSLEPASSAMLSFEFVSSSPMVSLESVSFGSISAWSHLSKANQRKRANPQMSVNLPLKLSRTTYGHFSR